jgi:ribonuclease Z
MKVTLLGTGTPWPDLRRQGPAVLVEKDGEHLLFDAGRGVVYQALKANVTSAKINPVFLTHHHFDHIGDLFDIILSSWTAGRTETLRIFGPSGTTEIVSALVTNIYWRDIIFRVKECAAMGNVHLDGTNISKLDVTEITEPGVVYQSDVFKVSAEFVKHHYDDQPPDFDWKCLGYRITSNDRSVVVSGDSVSCAGLDKLAKNADLLIQCCISADKDNQTPWRKQLSQYVLPAAGEVGKIASRANVPHLVLTHIGEIATVDDMVLEVRQSYQGKLTVGEDLLEIEV